MGKNVETSYFGHLLYNLVELKLNDGSIATILKKFLMSFLNFGRLEPKLAL